MTESQKDTARAITAAKAIVDRRDPLREDSSIMVTLEHTVAAVLLTLYRDPAKAVAMMNEGLVQGVEQRLSDYTAGKTGPRAR